MSRRPQNPTAERAAANQQTLKTLVKVESNKSCADCKRNKHPRWASWSLGVFLCIRCSGIHRGMGTHISRVKSVDLDAWTDEQLQNMIKWGNARANKYWEAKLAPGHMPAEAKIENFIRTKYDSKRWVMDGPMPDPSTLGGDEDVPLNVVQEKVKRERGNSLRNASASAQILPQQPSARQEIDLFGDEPPQPLPKDQPNRSISADPNPARASQQPKPPAAQKPTKPGDSLLGFDFFGSSNDSQARPSSATSNTTTNSRPDLKQSILSLYASAPKPAPQQQHSRSSSNQANPLDAPPQQSTFDAFSSLSLTSPPLQSASASSARSSGFPGLSSPKAEAAPPVSTSAFSTGGSISGGGFFDTAPAKPASPPTQQPASRAQRGWSASSGFGDFTSGPSPVSTNPPPGASNGMQDLFDLSSPGPTPSSASQFQSTPTAAPALSPAITPSAAAAPAAPPKPKPQNPAFPSAAAYTSAFNLSSPKPADPPRHTPRQPSNSSSTMPTSAGFGTGVMDPWGSSDVWASTSAPAPPPTQTQTVFTQSQTAPPAPPKFSPPMSSPSGDWGWSSNSGAAFGTGAGASGPRVTADEDFGGWEAGASPITSSAPANSNSNAGAQSKPFTPAKSAFAGDDLFSNVWQ